MPIPVLIGVLISLAVYAVLLLTPLGRRTLDHPLRLLLLLALAIYAAYDAKNTLYIQENDWGAHAFYFEYLYRYRELPASIDGWQFYQPPVYYLLGMPFYLIGKLPGVNDPNLMLRYYSLCCMLVLLVYAIALFRLFTAKRHVIWLAAALMVLWPLSLVHGGKINNDVLMHTLIVAGLYYLTRWMRLSDAKDLLAACVIAAVTLAVKTTALTLVVTVLACMAWRWLKQPVLRKSLFPKRYLIPAAMLLIACAVLNFGRLPNVGWFNTELQTEEEYFGVRHWRLWDQTTFLPAPPSQLVRLGTRMESESLLSYFWFDPITFILDPYWWPEHTPEFGEASNRIFFWNSWLKSLLVGRGGFLKAGLAQAVSVGFLGILLLMVFSLPMAARESAKQRRMLLAPVLLFFASACAIIYMRHRFLLNDCAEGRYVFYLVPVLIVFYIASLSWQYRKGRRGLAWGGMGLGAAISAGFGLHIVHSLA